MIQQHTSEPSLATTPTMTTNEKNEDNGGCRRPNPNYEPCTTTDQLMMARGVSMVLTGLITHSRLRVPENLCGEP